MVGVNIEVEPALLSYARKYSGLTLEKVAKKAKIAESKIKSYEERRTPIPVTQVEKLALAYKRPLAFFLLSSVPKDAVEPKNFRIIYSSETEKDFSPEAYMAIRRARYIQSVIADLGETSLTYSFKTISVSESANDVATHFRKTLNITLEDQCSWSSAGEALRAWRRAVENLGVFVLQHKIPKKNEMSAFCLADKKPYVVMLNSFEHEYRRIFSLFHEIGHLHLHESGICTPDHLDENSFEYRKIEIFCNAFSSVFLLPQDEFLKDSQVTRLKSLPQESWLQALKDLSAKFRVSRETVLTRCLNLGLISEKDYGDRKREIHDSNEFFKPKKDVIIPQHIKCISQNGRGFTSFVLSQYQNNKISYSSAADYLNISPRFIPKLQAHMR